MLLQQVTRPGKPRGNQNLQQEIREETGRRFINVLNEIHFTVIFTHRKYYLFSAGSLKMLGWIWNLGATFSREMHSWTLVTLPSAMAMSFRTLYWNAPGVILAASSVLRVPLLALRLPIQILVGFTPWLSGGADVKISKFRTLIKEL